ncbi:uncharacterized protein LOC112569530 [Pomacea canaliculata]|uniref:uncharacterized protein LOC112569530 n=1 Tax=Pomacea canaliculata TaxID=400727 RepID=UPI000D73FC2F|nr:uncharacterized protein LOC112569530 [Pomacea canaliculata]
MFPKVRLYTMGCVMFSILALVLEQTSGVEIVNCGPDKPLVVDETSTHFEVDCVNVNEEFEVFWHFNYTYGDRAMDMKAAHCVKKNKCKNYTRYVNVHSNSYKIVVNIAEFLKYYLLNGITCSERNPHGIESSYTCGIRIKRKLKKYGGVVTKGDFDSKRYKG